MSYTIIAADLESKKPSPRLPRQPRIKGLCQAAKQLGVHRNYLYMVLSGRRISHSLKARYEALLPRA